MSARGPIADIYPLSPVQQGILYHLLATEEKGLYLCQMTCRLRGALDQEAFHRALERLIERHDALRTSFLWEDLDEPLQVVDVRVASPLAEADWSALPEEERRQRLEGYLAADRATGFDLSRAPLTRLLVAREGDGVHRLVWTLPMLLADGWSTSVLIRDLFALYDALRQGAEAALPWPRPYRDFIAWRMRQDPAEAERFWRRELEGVVGPTALPGASGSGGLPVLAEHELRLSEELTAALQEMAGGARLTLNTLLYGAWAQWLARTTGEDDVVFGTTAAGRPSEIDGVESMVGVFINTLPVRARVDPARPLLDWLRDLQERQAEARHFDYALLVDVQGWSAVPRGTPLFDSLVVLENYPVETSLDDSIAGLDVDELHWAEGTNYPLALVVLPGRRLTLRLIADTGRFDPPFARSLVGHVATLLEGMARRPGARLGELGLLSEAERHQVVHAWDETAAAPAEDGGTVHERVLAQARRTPEALAVAGGGGLTYRELAARAGRLAQRLRAEGLGAEARVVAVAAAPAEPDAVAAFLGVLQAGGAYLALDLPCPAGRIVSALRESGAAALLVQGSLRPLMPAQFPEGIPVLFLEELLGGEGDGEEESAAVPADGLACLVLSPLWTGRPHVVALTHANLLHLAGPLATPAACAAATPEVWAALVHGRCPSGVLPALGARLYLLDRWLDPVPVGITGEVYAGGDGVPRGFLGRPDLTAERCLPDPFGSAGGRIFRTGCLARHRPDGTLEAVGRVEPPDSLLPADPLEVEAALAVHPALREVAVVAHRGGGERHLVAYVVPAQEAAAGPDELRAWLAARLPASMLPSAFAVLDGLPRRPNGRVDRRALVDLELRPAVPAAEGAPLLAVEEVIAAIWCDVLERETVGHDQNFFALGGHSLQAVRVISRLRGAFGVEVSIQELFESRTVAGLAKRVETALRTGAGAGPEAIGRAARDAGLAPSFAQQRLWFLDRLQPGNPAYHVALAVHLEGPLHAPAFAAGLAEVVARHEALRTTFAAAGGEPVQQVGPATPVPLPVVDLEGLPAASREEELLALARVEARRPFDLARGPVLRALLLRQSRRDHVLLLTVHHVAADGWSLGVLLRELAALYPAAAAGHPSPLPPLAVQYADFAAWQRRRLQGEVLQGLLDRWRGRLQGADGQALPADRPRPAVQGHHGRTFRFALPPALSTALRQLALRSGATVYMTLLAAFSSLVHRHTHSRRLAFGSPVAGRTRPEIEPLIGLFVNTLVVTPEVAGDPSFVELLLSVRRMVIAAQVDQELPFELLVQELRPERDLSRQPLFQMMFQQHNVPVPELRLGELAVTPLELDHGTAKFDLTLGFREVDGALRGSLEYSADLYDAPTIQRLAGQLEALLAAAVPDPERRLSELDAIPTAQRHQLLMEINDTAWAPPQPPFLHLRFAAQARRTPGDTALVAAGRRYSYRELEHEAGRLARRLRALPPPGSGPERLVGVHLRRGPELVIALLAILQAGAAYVPLDPGLPDERLAFLIAAAGCAALVSRRPESACLPSVRVPVLDVDLEGEEEGSGAEPDWPVSPANVAYVLFTSGSTGEPKGVAVHHAALMSYLDWAVRAYGLGPGSAVPLHSSAAFDLTVTSLFCPLLAGGTVVVVDEESGPGGLAAVLGAEELGLVKLTPSHLEVLRHLPRPGTGVAGVLVVGGEALRGEALEWPRGQWPGVRIVNEYGPTETVVGCAVYEVPPGPPAPGPVPIGRPIAGTRLYVVDGELRLVPLGAAGELCIAGAGVARGYWGRPDLTAARFLPDPFASAAGERMYRSGDLVRRLPAGDLLYLGRLDHQVKVRGYRIEPEEIEARLRAHPAVRAAAVAVVPDRFGERRLIAYVVAPAEEFAEAELSSFVGDRLPDYMLPARFVRLDELPLTASGKVDRKALPALAPAARPGTGATDRRSPVEQAVAGIWCEVLERDEVGLHESFFDAGGSSLGMVRVQARLQERFGRELPLVELFRWPTVAALAGVLGPAAAAQGVPAAPAAHRSAEVAIVGMACRVPGASTPAELWRNLCGGVDAVSTFSAEELAAAGIPRAEIEDPRYVRRRGVLAGADQFDAPFFGISPREAELLDPQQRLFLECAWHALEDAGHAGDGDLRVGVFAGTGLSRYALLLLAAPELAQEHRLLTANDKDFLPTRVSYKLNLRGPSVAVQTACSSSLMAVRLACRSLVDGECDTALAGGVSISLPQPAGYLHEDGGILAPDGCCRAFDARAQGTVPGSGLGIVVLRRLEDALADGDRIYAVIKGSAVNNDGADKVGYFAPSVNGQAAAVRAALAAAGVPAATVGYVETHGTGTALGDPIEVAALKEAFGGEGRCALGSVKTAIGHLDAAAGVAGLIKAALAVRHGKIPPVLHFERPHPALGLAESPFYVNTSLVNWQPAGAPRRAGVSSFGIGGTNVHMVLEEAPPPAPSSPSCPWQLLVLSARSEVALDTLSRDLAERLRQPGVELPDLAYTLQVGRRRLPVRRTLVCRDAAEAARELADPASRRVFTATEEVADRPVAFLFPGQGAQHPGMALGLYRGEATFGAELDRCAELLRPDLGLDLRTALFPAAGETAAADLQRTGLAQPALFAVEYALARQWMEWGVIPGALAGHSIGELVAACLAGVMSLRSALALVAARGRLMEARPTGAMLSVDLSEAEAAGLCGDGLSLAAVNGPSQCVLSGTAEAIGDAAERLAERGIAHHRLRVSHAFHSSMMEPVLADFRREVARVALQPPRLPIVSCVSGRWLQPAEATDPEYWVRQLRATVRFGAAVRTLCEMPCVLLEVGPGRTLVTLARRLPECAGRTLVSSLGSARETGANDAGSVREALGRLWAAGVRIDWHRFWAGERRHRTEAPCYPFERRRYWIDPGRRATAVEAARRPDVADWFYLPAWRQTAPPALLDGAVEEGEAAWLVLCDAGGGSPSLGERVVRFLERRGATVFGIRPDETADYERLVAEAAGGGRPLSLLHLWSLDAAAPAAAGWRARLDRATELGFYSLLRLLQAIGRRVQGPVRLGVVTHGAQQLHDGEEVTPEAALVLGLLRSAPAEYPNLACRAIDVDLPGDAAGGERLAGLLVEEMDVRSADPVVAYRGGSRWVESFAEARLRPASPARLPLRQRGTYLVTGGLGGIGLTLGRHLATAAAARLVLVGRSAVPPRQDWDAWLSGHGDSDPVSRRILRLREIEAAGGEIQVEAADVSDPQAMAGVLHRARQRFGPIHGVVHAAGVPAGGLLQTKTPEAAEAVLAPKVGAALLLDDLLAGEPLDFFVVCSSLRSVLGGAGRSDYAAANAFLDAFARWRSRRRGRTLSIGWDTWSEVGMSVASAGVGGEGLADGIRCAEGVEVFLRALGSGLPQMLVSTVDLGRRIEQARAFSAVEALQSIEVPDPGRARPAHQRPKLSAEYAPPRTAAESQLAGIWQDLLGIGPIGIHDDFFELGGDSVVSLQVIARARKLGIEVTPVQVFESRTIGELAAVAGTGQVLRAEQGEVTGQLPLTPAQSWFFELGPPEPRHWNQALMLQVLEPMAAGRLDAAVACLLRHHDALRLRFRREEDVWRQWNAGCEPAAPVLWADLSALPAERRREAVEQTAAQAQTALDLAAGPLFRAVLYHYEEGRPGRLLLVAHHLGVDAVSWRILLEDLQSACHQIARGETSHLPAKTTSFRRWAECLRAEALAGRFAPELPYWTAEPRRRLPPLPQDLSGANVAGSACRLAVALSLDESRTLLSELPKTLRAGVQDALLAALARACWRWTGEPRLLVDLEGHGREPLRDELDLSRTVGWFTAVYPVLLDLAGTATQREALARVKAQVAAVPGKGLGYGALRYLAPAAAGGEALAAMPRAEVQFLYLGQAAHDSGGGALFAEADESTGPLQAADAPRGHLLDVLASIAGGRLQVVWIYSAGVHGRTTVERLAEAFLDELRALLVLCRQAETAVYTPSDFPQAGLSSQELQDLLQDLDPTLQGGAR